MKLKNRQKNNFFEVDEAIMRGTIEMSLKEFESSWNYIVKEYNKAVKNIDTYKRDALSNTMRDLEGYQNAMEGGKPFCLHIEATKLLVKKYNLKNYRDVNYAIIIK